MRLLIALSLCVAAAASAGEPPPPAAQKEIRHLLAYLDRSACEFNRNGSWYAAGEARRHLDQKYGAAAGRGLIRTAEDFVLGVGSVSSLSGQPYQVRCPGSAVVPSATWLNGELMRFRKQAGAGS